MQRLQDTTRIASITCTLEPSYRKMLERISADNANTICDYIFAEIAECNIADATKAWKIKVLVYLSRFLQHKNFKDTTKEDILAYLNTLRKPESVDPKHKSIGTYTNRVLVYTKFFRWLYNPDEPDPKKRITPPCMRGIKRLKRREKSPYEPADMWTSTEHAIFLRYCPSKRDKCYFAIARDTSARPSELLALRIRDIKLKIETTSGRQYAEILASGKTGSRTLPLIDSLPYVKDWLAVHPLCGNVDAPLFISQSDRAPGKRLTIDGIWWHLKYFKTKVFPLLLEDKSLPNEDRRTISDMLQKKWNPYVFRHSALTEKAQILTEANLRNHAGWSNISKMPSVYLHFFGTESSRSLLEAKGIVNTQHSENRVLQNKTCPHCDEPNTPQSKFCMRCKMVLTYEEYVGTRTAQQQFESEFRELKEWKAQTEAKLDRIFSASP